VDPLLQGILENLTALGLAAGMLWYFGNGQNRQHDNTRSLIAHMTSLVNTQKEQDERHETMRREQATRDERQTLALETQATAVTNIGQVLAQIVTSQTDIMTAVSTVGHGVDKTQSVVDDIKATVSDENFRVRYGALTQPILDRIDAVAKRIEHLIAQFDARGDVEAQVARLHRAQGVIETNQLLLTAVIERIAKEQALKQEEQQDETTRGNSDVPAPAVAAVDGDGAGAGADGGGGDAATE